MGRRWFSTYTFAFLWRLIFFFGLLLFLARCSHKHLKERIWIWDIQCFPAKRLRKIFMSNYYVKAHASKQLCTTRSRTSYWNSNNWRLSTLCLLCQCRSKSKVVHSPFASSAGLDSWAISVCCLRSHLGRCWPRPVLKALEKTPTFH